MYQFSAFREVLIHTLSFLCDRTELKPAVRRSTRPVYAGIKRPRPQVRLFSPSLSLSQPITHCALLRHKLYSMNLRRRRRSGMRSPFEKMRRRRVYQASCGGGPMAHVLCMCAERWRHCVKMIYILTQRYLEKVARAGCCAGCVANLLGNCCSCLTGSSHFIR